MRENIHHISLVNQKLTNKHRHPEDGEEMKYFRRELENIVVRV